MTIHLDNNAFAKLYLELVSVNVPDDVAQRLATTVLGSEREPNAFGRGVTRFNVVNICELWFPWWAQPDTHLLCLSRPSNPAGLQQTVWVATLYPHLPDMAKRVVWSANRGTVFDPIIHPEPQGWLADRIFKANTP